MRSSWVRYTSRRGKIALSHNVFFVGIEPNGITPTMNQSLYDIWDHFHSSLTEEESSLFTGAVLAKLRQIAEIWAENHMRDSKRGHFLFGGRGRRVVMCILEVCPRFTDMGRFVSPSWAIVIFKVWTSYESKFSPTTVCSDSDTSLTYSVLSTRSTGTRCLNVVFISTRNGG